MTPRRRFLAAAAAAFAGRTSTTTAQPPPGLRATVTLNGATYSYDEATGARASDHSHVRRFKQQAQNFLACFSSCSV